jgi:hypothetical protein
MWLCAGIHAVGAGVVLQIQKCKQYVSKSFTVFVYCRCVIVELFTEGKSPFDLSQLLAYRTGDYSPVKLLESIDDANIRVGFTVFHD